MNLKEYELMCLRNYSCTAYANSNIKGGSGCLLWFDDLIDIRYFTQNGLEFYVRMVALKLGMKYFFFFWCVYSNFMVYLFKDFSSTPHLAYVSSFIPRFFHFKLCLFLKRCLCEKSETNYQEHYFME